MAGRTSYRKISGKVLISDKLLPSKGTGESSLPASGEDEKKEVIIFALFGGCRFWQAGLHLGAI